MSCFIVSNDTIRRVVEAATAHKGNDVNQPRIGADSFGSLETPLLSPLYDLSIADSLLTLTQDLYNLNVAAYVARYPSEAGTVPPFYPKDFPVFWPGDGTTEVSRIVAFKAAKCLLYQCHEGTVPETPLYKALKQFIADLAIETVSQTDDYDASPWG